MKYWCFTPLFAGSLLGLISLGATAKTVHVSSRSALVHAVKQAQPGTTILVAPGTYAGGMFFTDVHGGPNAPIVIAAENPHRPPLINGHTEGMHFADPAWLQLKNLAFKGSTGNDLNIDDRGSDQFTAHDIVLKGLHIINTAYGPYIQGIKLTGLKNLRIENCRIDSYPVDIGSGIDIAGSKNVVIDGCTFKQTYRAIQMKGGMDHVQVTHNHFVQPFVGHGRDIRELQIGGSMGACCLGHFKTKPWAQARDVTVAGNTFVGSQTPVLFIGSVDATVKYNTFYRPGKWIFRILRENRGSRFAKTRDGVFTHNIIVYRTSEMEPSYPVDIGPASSGVLPGSFTIGHNWWYAENDPRRSKPVFSGRLPGEADGVYGTDPQLANASRDDLSLKPDSPAKAYGAGAYPHASSGSKPPPKGLRIVAVSSEQGANAAKKAIDGNHSTYWHSKAPLSRNPQWIEIGLAHTRTIKQLNYLPPQGGNNGVILLYEIYTSTDGKHWKPATAGLWAVTQAKKSARFPAVKAAYVKLVAVAGLHNSAAAAEIAVK
jgi:hypothetical protein